MFDFLPIVQGTHWPSGWLGIYRGDGLTLLTRWVERYPD